MFMDCHSIIIQRLGFVALVCLMLAVKFEEIDSNLPKISDLKKFDGLQYPNKDFIRVEAMVLKRLNFDLTQPTAANFAEYYELAAVVPQDEEMSELSFQRLGELVRKVIKEFLDISLKEVNILKIRPSQTAAACVYSARYVMDLSPVWTDELTYVTGYSEEDISSCVQLLIDGMRQKEAKNRHVFSSPDSGYTSDSP